MTASLVDLASGQLTRGTVTGTYSIAASGQGFLSSPVVNGDFIFGLVNQQGIFVGSSTENLNGYNDLFIAAPLAGMGVDYRGVSCPVGEQVCGDAVWIPHNALLADEPQVLLLAEAIRKVVAGATALRPST
jgi:hypothetical protein